MQVNQIEIKVKIDNEFFILSEQMNNDIFFKIIFSINDFFH